MKLQTVISTTLVVMIAALSVNAQAADTDTAKPAAEAKMDQGAPASQPQSAASAPAAKKHPAQDRSKHYHPRDGK